MVSNEAGDEARMMRDAAVLGKLEPGVFESSFTVLLRERKKALPQQGLTVVKTRRASFYAG
jgi:hypothetical protein